VYVPSSPSYLCLLLYQGNGRTTAYFRKHDTDTSPAKGLGAANAPAHKEHPAPGSAPVASDSENSNVGVDSSANNPGEKGIGGPNYGSH
jgi:hypothetical protein